MIVALGIGGGSDHFCETDMADLWASRCCKRRQGAMELL